MKKQCFQPHEYNSNRNDIEMLIETRVYSDINLLHHQLHTGKNTYKKMPKMQLEKLRLTIPNRQHNKQHHVYRKCN